MHRALFVVTLMTLLIAVSSACDDEGTPPGTDACSGNCDAQAADGPAPDLSGQEDAGLEAGEDGPAVADLGPDVLPSTWVGSTCTSAASCSGTGADVQCLQEGEWGWPDGYCSQSCDPTADVDTCPAGSHCEELAQEGPNIESCIKDCLTKQDCRDGYVCAPIPESNTGGCIPFG
jgi:hypothetical protein